MKNFQTERIALGAMAIGHCTRALELTLDYVRQRPAFGGTLWDKQVIRQRLAMLDAKTRAARQFMYHCAWSVTQDKDIVQEVSMLKALTGELVNEVVQTCQQFHGGMGYIRETAIERLWRDSRILGIGGGATEVMLDEVAKRYFMTTAQKTLDIRRPSKWVAEVWLNRPDVRNAFNDDVIAELTEAFQHLGQDNDLRAIVLGAHGKAFCAGADLNWMRAMSGYSWEENRADAQKLADMLWTLDQCPVPIVGRLQGDCYAGGMGLASVCDVLIASDNVTFCLSEARLGLLPGTISPYVVRAMGAQAAKRYMVTAERFSATQAHAMGMVHELCTSETLDAKVAEVVGTLCGNGPQALRACKRLVQDVTHQPINEALRAETARRIADIRASDEGKEGLQSFLQKRPAQWTQTN
jgi:methylglutaconyl-CoA hydratase